MWRKRSGQIFQYSTWLRNPKLCLCGGASQRDAWYAKSLQLLSWAVARWSLSVHHILMKTICANWKGGRTPYYAGQILRRLEANAFPTIGRRPVAELDPRGGSTCCARSSSVGRTKRLDG